MRQTLVRRCHGGWGSSGLPGIGKSEHDGGASAFGAGEVFRGSKSKAPPSLPLVPAVHWQIDFLVPLPPVRVLFLRAKHLFVAANPNAARGSTSLAAHGVRSPLDGKLLLLRHRGAGQKFAPSCGDARRPSTHRSMFIVPHGAPEGYEWFVALVVLVGLYFAVRNFMRARR